MPRESAVEVAPIVAPHSLAPLAAKKLPSHLTLYMYFCISQSVSYFTGRLLYHKGYNSTGFSIRMVCYVGLVCGTFLGVEA